MSKGLGGNIWLPPPPNKCFHFPSLDPGGPHLIGTFCLLHAPLGGFTVNVFDIAPQGRKVRAVHGSFVARH